MSDEAHRLKTLLKYDILDTVPEQAYDDITKLAAFICDTPIALISLIDSDRQWFKSKVGLATKETDRSVAFCAHAIQEPEKLLVVSDATIDPRFFDNPLVTGEPHIRFYAGAPLNIDNAGLGTLCVIDNKPRELTSHQLDALRALSRGVVSHFELYLTQNKLKDANEATRKLKRNLLDELNKLMVET